MHPVDVCRRSLLGRSVGLLALTSGLANGLAHAQTSAQTHAQATRLRILCIAPPGGSPDLIARTYADALGRHFPAGVVVENRPGAGGQIAIGALKQSAPDGATMLLAHAGVSTLNPHLYTRLNYDPETDLAPVSLAADTDFALALGTGVPTEVRSFDEFVAWARANPSACNHGSPGVGTLPHLIGAMLFRQIRVDAQHVSYPGGPQAIGDAVGGRLAVLVLPVGLLRPYHATGKLRAIATTGEARSRFMAEVPTLAERGQGLLMVRDWFGFFMPGATPPVVVEAMSRAVRAAAESAQVWTTLADMAMRVVTATPEAMVQRIADERRQWKSVITAMGLRLD